MSWWHDGLDSKLRMNSPCPNQSTVYWKQSPFYLNLNWVPYPLRFASTKVLSSADDHLQQELLDRLVDSRLMGPSLQSSMNHDPARLPLKELPHGSWMNMYLMYRAWAHSKQEKPASKSTFFNVINSWKVCVKFHRRTHHQMCLTCSTLRAAILNTDDSLIVSDICNLSYFYYFNKPPKNWQKPLI